MDAADGTLHISDQELASLRKLKVLEVLCEDVLPRSLSEIQRLSAQLEQRRGSLRNGRLRAHRPHDGVHRSTTPTHQPRPPEGAVGECTPATL